MTIQDEKQPDIKISKSKLIYGGIILIVSFIAPLFIPLILELNISPSLKAIISSLLLFGIPEVGILLAVIILGKEGYIYLKSCLLFWRKKKSK